MHTAWNNRSYDMMVRSMKNFELHYPVIQFLITRPIIRLIIVEVTAEIIRS